MPKKTSPYILIAALNMAVLTVLLAFWTDELLRTFNDNVRPVEFLKIIGFTALSLIGMRILDFFFQKKNIQVIRTKILAASLLSLLISSPLYIYYTAKFMDHAIVNRSFRSDLFHKINPSNGLSSGTTAQNLTLEEYHVIADMTGFPILPPEASNITYSHQVDDFLGDYSFSMMYDLSKHVAVETLNRTNGDFMQYRSFEVVDNRKRVTYTEGKQ